MDIPISGTAYRVVDLNGDIEMFIEEQLKYGGKLVEFLSENTKVFIKACDVENNMYKPLYERQLNIIVDNAPS